MLYVVKMTCDPMWQLGLKLWSFFVANDRLLSFRYEAPSETQGGFHLMS